MKLAVKKKGFEAPQYKRGPLTRWMVTHGFETWALRRELHLPWITAAVYERLHDSAKYRTPRQDMWEKRTWTKLPGVDIFRSSWERD